jgi:PleD family two-component response regulator
MTIISTWNSPQTAPAAAPKVDPVTGLGNAAMFKHETLKAIARYRRIGEPFSVLLIATGERGAGDPGRHSAIAKLLSGAVREEDTPCHLSGRQFAIVLSGAPEVGARAALERILTAASWQPGRANSASPTAGVATWSEHFNEFDDILDAARTALSNESRIRTEHTNDWAQGNS